MKKKQKGLMNKSKIFYTSAQFDVCKYIVMCDVKKYILYTV